MDERDSIEARDECRRVIQHSAQRRSQQHDLISEKENRADDSQQNGWQIEVHGPPVLLVEQTMTNRINRAEMQKQRRQQNEGRVVENRNRRIQIAITSDRCERMKNERG